MSERRRSDDHINITYIRVLLLVSLETSTLTSQSFIEENASSSSTQFRLDGVLSIDCAHKRKNTQYCINNCTKVSMII